MRFAREQSIFPFSPFWPRSWPPPAFCGWCNAVDGAIQTVVDDIKAHKSDKTLSNGILNNHFFHSLSLVSVFYSTFTSNSAPCRRLLHRKRTDGLKVVKSNENITFQLRPGPAGGKFIYALAAPRYLHLTPTFVHFSTQGQQVKLPMYLRKTKSKRREIVVVVVPPPYFFYLFSGNYFRVKNDSCFGTNWIYLPFALCARRHDE